MKIHAVGDSWTCREGDTVLDRGWQAYALPPECRHGVSGTTAEQWATNHNGMRSRALAACSEGDVVIISLVGNDIRHAADDGNISIPELYSATAALYNVVSRFRAHGCTVVMLLYADPYRGHNIEASKGVMLINTIIRGVATIHGCELLETSEILRRPAHFDGRDFHPTAAGHHAIADYILKRWR